MPPAHFAACELKMKHNQSHVTVACIVLPLVILFGTSTQAADPWAGTESRRPTARCSPGKGRVEGLNAFPGGIGLESRNRVGPGWPQGCASWCGMHADDAKINKLRASAPQTMIDKAEREASFFVVDQWRGIDSPHYRFTAHDVEQNPSKLAGRQVPAGKLAVAHNMDPYDLAGKRLFDMAPSLNITMSYSMRASVIMTFAPLNFFATVSQLPEPVLSEKPGLVVWVSSNCRPTMTYHRDVIVKELMSHIHIDARGACHNNAPRFKSNYGIGLDKEYSKYKFALVMENSIEIDWVTEKFFLPFLANTVPVYYGAPNIAAYAPGPHSFINMRDFDSPQALAERLKYLADPTNKDEYLAYFAWRKTQRTIPPTLKRIEQLSMHRPSISCDLCACICDKDCRHSGADILQYPHLPQISPWEQQPAIGQRKQQLQDRTHEHVMGRHSFSNRERSAFGRRQGVQEALKDELE